MPPQYTVHHFQEGIVIRISKNSYLFRAGEERPYLATQPYIRKFGPHGTLVVRSGPELKKYGMATQVEQDAHWWRQWGYSSKAQGMDYCNAIVYAMLSGECGVDYISPQDLLKLSSLHGLTGADMLLLYQHGHTLFDHEALRMLEEVDPQGRVDIADMLHALEKDVLWTHGCQLAAGCAQEQKGDLCDEMTPPSTPSNCSAYSDLENLMCYEDVHTESPSRKLSM